MIKFKNAITEEDFIEYNIFHMNNSKTMKNTSLGIRVIFPVAFMMLGVLSGKELDMIFWTILLVGSVGVFLWIPSVMNKSVRKRISKMISEGKNGEMFTEKEYTFDDSGIKMESANSSGFYKWDSITKIEESESSIYLFISTVQAIIVPKESINSITSISEFREYVDMRIDNRK